MALTEEQQALLEALQAKAAEKEPRTETGLKGVLHAVLDVVSGNVAHLPADAWEVLHSTVEHYDETHPAEPEPVQEHVQTPVQYGTEGTGFTG